MKSAAKSETITEAASEEVSATTSETPAEEPHVTRKQRKELLADTQERQERTLFIGNLPLACCTDKKLSGALKRRFAKHGRVESIRFRSIAFAEPQARRTAFIKQTFRKTSTTCNGYVVMASCEEARAALVENATVFAERHLRVDLATGDSSSKTNTKKSVFIGNLSMEIEEEPVWRFFERCGAVTNVRLVRDRVTNVGKGFGYVTFSTRDAADLATKLAGTTLQGRPVRVARCCKEGRIEKQRVHVEKLAEKRAKVRNSLVKEDRPAQTARPGQLGASKRVVPQPVPMAEKPKKLSKQEAKLQAELKTKFGQLLHKKYPFSQALGSLPSGSAEKGEKEEKTKKTTTTTTGERGGADRTGRLNERAVDRPRERSKGASTKPTGGVSRPVHQSHNRSDREREGKREGKRGEREGKRDRDGKRGEREGKRGEREDKPKPKSKPEHKHAASTDKPRKKTRVEAVKK